MNWLAASRASFILLLKMSWRLALTAGFVFALFSFSPPAMAAITEGGATCTASDKTASTTLSCAVTTESFEAGNVAVLLFAGDNVATTSGNEVLLSGVTDSQGNDWTVERCYTNARLAANLGAMTCIAQSKLETALTTSDSITATYSSITAKAMVVKEFSVATSSRLVLVGTPEDEGRTATDPGSLTVSGLPSGAEEYLYLRSVALERTAGGAWSTTSAFTTTGCAGTSGSTSGSNMEVCGEYQIIATSSAVSSNPTASDDDSASTYIAFDEVDYNLYAYGTLYESDRYTPVATPQTVVMALVATSSLVTFSTTTEATTGSFSFFASLNSLVATGTPVSVYIYNSGTLSGVTVTKTSGTNTLPSLPLSAGRLTVSHEADSGTSLTISNLSHYDADDDVDIPYTANAGVLTVARGTDLFVSAGKTFSPGGRVNASSSLTIAAEATYDAPASTTVNGAFANHGTFTHNDGTLTMESLYSNVFSYLNGRDVSGSSGGSFGRAFLAFAAAGNTLYVGKNGINTACSQTAGSAVGCELMVFDISSTTNPIYVAGRDASGDSGGTGNAIFYSLAVSGDTLFVANGADATACSQTAGSAIGCELLVFDISSTTNPIYVAGRDTSGSSDGTGSNVIQALRVEDNILFAAKSNNTTACSQTAGSAIGCELMVFDISSTTNPIYVAGRDATGDSTGVDGLTAYSLYTVGSTLFVGKSSSATACSQTAGSAIGCELMVFDISSTTNPIYVAGRDVSGSSDGTGSVQINELTVNGDTLFVAKSNSATACSQTAGSAIGCELMAFDISSTTNPIYVAGRDSSGDSGGVGSVAMDSLQVIGSTLFVGKLLDSTATACSEIAGSAIGCELMAFDISSTTNPIYVAGRDSSGDSGGVGAISIQAFHVVDDILFVAKSNSATACSQTAGSAIGCELMVFSANLGDKGFLAGTLTSTSSLYDIVTSGVVDFASNASTTNLTITTGELTLPLQLSVSGDYTNNGTVTTLEHSTVDFIGTSAQDIDGSLSGGSTFAGVTFSGSGTKTLASPASTTGDMVIINGATVVTSDPVSVGGDFVSAGTFNAPTYLTMEGNYNNTGTFTADSGIVELKSYITDYLAGVDASGNNDGVGSGAVQEFIIVRDTLYAATTNNTTACSQTAGSAIGCELLVFNISSTTNPIFVAGRDATGNSTGAGGAIIYTLAVKGNTLYAGKSSSGTACSQTAGSAIGCELIVFDISSTTNPIYVAGRDVSGNSDGTGSSVSIHSLKVAGDTLFVAKSNSATACSQTAGSAIGCEFMMFDISSTTNPVYVAGRDVTGNAAGTGSALINTLHVINNTVYVGKSGSATPCSQTAGSAIGCELMAFDISSTTNPVYVAGRDASGSSDGNGSVFIYDFIDNGTILYASKSNNTTACSQTSGSAIGCELIVFDISSTTNPIYVAGRDASGNSDGTGSVTMYSLYISGDDLLVGKNADATACSEMAGFAVGCELMVFDISSTTNPIYVAGRDASGDNEGIESLIIRPFEVAHDTLFAGKGGSTTACSQTAGSAIGCEIMVFDLASNLSGTMVGTSAFADISVTGVGAHFLTAASTTDLTLATSSVLKTTADFSVSDTLTAYGSTTLVLAAGATTRVDDLNLLGVEDTMVTIRSTASGTQSNLVATGVTTVTYTTITDSDACGSTGGEIDVSSGNNTDGGNTDCWNFTPTPDLSLTQSHDFYVGQATTSLGTITITDVETPSITAAGDIRLAIATTTTDFRFDTTDTTPTFGGTASGKVGGTVTYEDDGAILLIDVTENFAATNTLTVAGLLVGDFVSVSTTTSRLGLHIDGDSAGTPIAMSSETFRITGLMTVADHGEGQVTNQFSFANETDEPFFAFNLVPTGETATVTDLVFTLRGIQGVSTNEFDNFSLYRDDNADGLIDGGDTLLDNAGIMTQNGQHGAITFSANFLATTTMNYLVTADTTDIDNDDTLVISLANSGVAALGTTSNYQPTVTGAVADVQHARFRSGGGGAGIYRIGGAPPAGDGIQGGGDDDGGDGVGDDEDGENITPDADFYRPSGTAEPSEWQVPENAYLSDGVSATTSTNAARQTYINFTFNIPGGNAVKGIAVKLDASGSTAAGTIDVALSWDGGSSYTTGKATPTLAGSDIVYTVGGATDLWGRSSWTPTELNNTNFRLRVTADTSTTTLRLDALEVRVYHQATGGVPGGGGGI